MIAYKSDVVYPDVKNGKYRFVYEELFLKKKKKKKKRKLKKYKSKNKSYSEVDSGGKH